MDSTMLLVGAGLAVGLAGLGVSIGEGLLAGSSLDAIGKNPELEPVLKRITIIGLALVESAAIYGLLVAILLMYGGEFTSAQAIGAGLAVGAAGLGAGVGEGLVVKNAIQAILRNPSAESTIFNNMILFIALVESAAIYGLLVAILAMYG